MERGISRHGAARVMDMLAAQRGLPQVFRTDNGKKFCGKALVAWAREKVIALRLVEPGKPSQNAYVEFFNGGCAMTSEIALVPNVVPCRGQYRKLAA